MEKGFLDKVEDNAVVRIWSEKRQKEKGDSLSEGSLRDLILVYPDTKKRVDIFALSIYRLVIFPKVLGHIDDAVSDLFNLVDKRVTPVLTILAETFRSLSVYWRVAIGYAPQLILRQYRLRQFIPAMQGLAQCEFAYKGDNYKKKWERKLQDAQVREDALKRELLESQDEKVSFRALVVELERFLHQQRSRNSVIELKASLIKIEELNTEELEGQTRDRDHIMNKALTQVWKVADHLQTLTVQANMLSLRYELESDRGQELAWLLNKVKALRIRAGTSGPVNYPIGLGFNPEDSPTNPVVPDLDDMAKMERARVELPKQLEDLWKWLKEKFRAIETTDYLCRVNAKELSLVPDLVLLPKFKTPEFEKYNGISCPEAHITMFCRRMT
ncbi:hypothetical protein Golax_014553, partial [Gossypium laxum]|nr:hypothetical protein [Gossypium laxum]